MSPARTLEKNKYESARIELATHPSGGYIALPTCLHSHVTFGTRWITVKF